jgi:hypothetical protein
MFAETAIVVYHLSFADQEKQPSVFRFHLERTNESLRFRFPFVAYKKESCRFPLVPFPVFQHGHGDIEMETWKHGDTDMRHGNMEKSRHGDMDTKTWRHGHGYMDMETWTRIPKRFTFIRLMFARENGSSSFVRLLTKKHTEVIRLQTD